MISRGHNYLRIARRYQFNSYLRIFHGGSGRISLGKFWLDTCFSKSTERQVKGGWCVQTSDESVSLVKRFRLFIFCIHQQRVGNHKTSSAQTSVNCTTDQNLAQSATTAFNFACQASQPETGNRVTRQFFPFRVADLMNVYLCRTERVKAQDFVWHGVVHHDKNRAEALCVLLCRKFVQVIIKRWHPAMKGRSIMSPSIKNLLFKHA